MANKQPVNKALSVKTKLLNISQKKNVDINLVLKRYAIERFLYRLSQSSYIDKFVLKGAMLFVIWEEWPHRPTRDVDFLGFGPNEITTLERIFKEVIAIPVEDDGLWFDPESIIASQIKKDAIYLGVRIKMYGYLGSAKIAFQADIGYGDVVIPSPELVKYPTLLQHPAPYIKAYSIYTVIAEKFNAMIVLGLANTRIKDFYDIFYLISMFDFEGSILRQALIATLEKQETRFPQEMPQCLSEKFTEAEAVMQQWKSFLRKNGLDEKYSFKEVAVQLTNFFSPLIHKNPDMKKFLWSHEQKIWKFMPDFVNDMTQSYILH